MEELPQDVRDAVNHGVTSLPHSTTAIDGLSKAPFSVLISERGLDTSWTGDIGSLPEQARTSHREVGQGDKSSFSPPSLLPSPLLLGLSLKHFTRYIRLSNPTLPPPCA